MKTPMTRLQKIRHNAACKVISSFMLATALALVGTSLVELAVDSPNMETLVAIIFMLFGVLFLLGACAVNMELEDVEAGDGNSA